MSDPVENHDTTLLGARARVFVPGLLAWLITVLEPARQAGAALPARVAAGAGLVSLAAGSLVVTARPILGRSFGLYGFVATCLGAWALLGSELGADRMDRTRSLLGALAWLLFAFGWGHARRRAHAAGISPPFVGAPLLPRARAPRTSGIVAIVAVGSAFLCVVLAFRVERPEHALFAHAMATAAGLLLLAVAGRLALAQGQRFELPSGGSRLDAAALPAALLGVLFGLGLVWAALR